MSRRLRRHARLTAGALAMLLAGGLVYVLHGGGPAHAQPARSTAAILASLPGAARPVAQAGHRGAQASRAAVSSSRPATRQGAAPRAHGLPSAAPTSRDLALALHQVTGLTPSQVRTRRVCPPAAAGHARCAAEALVLRSNGSPVHPRVRRYRSLGHVKPAVAHGASPGAPTGRGPVQPALASASPPAPQPGTPAYLQQAYDLSYLSQTAGGNDTVAIVDAYDDPSAEADLAVYRSHYGLPACTTANGCFRKVNQSGLTSPLPAQNSNWAEEISLDLDAVSAVCPNCRILLVEANSTSLSDLGVGLREAPALGADQVSASWAGTSSSGLTTGYAPSGVATVAAAGDYGYVGAGQDNYPAALPGVTAAGGTSLATASVTSSARGFSEGAWGWNGQSGGGSGCDLHYDRPSYQPAWGCTGRAYADLSADADPATGLSVYANGQWLEVGGTSLSTPLIASYYAITGVTDTTPAWAYADGGLLNDVVGGSTGSCAAGISYICNAGVGYDGPTGVGSISGSVALGAPGIGGPTISAGTNAPNTYTQSVSSRGSTIVGGIYRNGLDTHWWIQYGTSTDYGQTTPQADIGAGSAPVAVTGYLSELNPSTTYHYRLVAANSRGTTYGYDYTFTTSAGSPTSPAAAFTVAPTVPAPGSSVTFDGSGSQPAGGITDYSWNFGDGSSADTGTSANTNHVFTAPGTYTVTLTTTDDLGMSDKTTRQVVVAPAPPPPTPAPTPPPPTPTPPAPTPAPPPIQPSPPAPPAPPAAPHLTATLTAAGKQRLAGALGHGLRLTLAVNQHAKGNIQITIPSSHTKASHAARATNVVLLRHAQTLAAGRHPLTFRLSRAAARRLPRTGPIVLTVRVKLTGAGGATLTRTVKIKLAR